MQKMRHLVLPLLWLTASFFFITNFHLNAPCVTETFHFQNKNKEKKGKTQETDAIYLILTIVTKKGQK